MAIGKLTDFKIYDDQINGGLVETLVQNTDAFNAASQNAIRLRTDRKRGQYEYESFFRDIANAITRRDPTSVADVADVALTQDEMISVKVNRKIGPVSNTLDSFRKIGEQGDAESLSFLIGTQIAKGMQVDMLNTALVSVVAAIRGVTVGGPKQRGLNYTVPASGKLDTDALVEGLSNMGDAQQNVVVWVMHSKPYFDLVKSQITANIDGISNFNVASGTPVTLNRPVLITDSDALRIMGTGSPGPDDYLTLGLTADAVVVTDAEEELIHTELATGKENLLVRLQGEFAYMLGTKGFKWDVGNGGANPTNTALGTSSNWDKVFNDVKNLAGVCIRSR